MVFNKLVKYKKNKNVQVAEYYGKLTPQTLAELVYQYCKYYNNAYAEMDLI